MEIKLSRLKQIISEVVQENYASERMDSIMQSARVEEVDPHDQALDEMIAEEIEAAIEKFIIGEDEGEAVDPKKAKCDELYIKANTLFATGDKKGAGETMDQWLKNCRDQGRPKIHEGTEGDSE